MWSHYGATWARVQSGHGVCDLEGTVGNEEVKIGSPGPVLIEDSGFEN